MTRHLVIHVRFHEARYHGAGDWPPSPARLFQALIAGAGLSGPIGRGNRHVFEWLESLDPPLVAAPHARDGKSFAMYVPGNDLDRFGGDPRRLSKIRDGKSVKPRLFDQTVPIVYAWQLGESVGSSEQAARVCTLADRLYQLGRGVDLAWAWGEVLDDNALDDLLTNYPGMIRRPSPAGRGLTLACPERGSFDSLEVRYRARRFTVARTGRMVRRVFSQPPPPRFAPIPYDSASKRFLYDLCVRGRSANTIFAPWPQARTAALAVQLRDLAADRLRRALPQRIAEIDRALIGRKPDGTNSGPTSARVRIIPLPSVGHAHADHEIRRVLVEVPADCPLLADDVEWAFSGLNLVNPHTGELLDVVLAPAQSPSGENMLSHYGVDNSSSRLWRTVTPAVLPYIPAMHRGRAISGAKRIRKIGDVSRAASQALRHASVRQRPISIGVQREPFVGGGECAEEFAAGTRFESDRLWHVEITFAEDVAGPLIIGDGRFLGLGLMAPAQIGGVDAEIIDGVAKDVA